jgi:radical SAM superfamily enzyme YgiQ (UPF0313 family)|tara:strand:+ start:93 stop:1541 length:1449 start_codon:yes stop_codon:yes gene_type:complete
MAKILFLNPNKWGRGITTIWITSHSSVLKNENHKVELFDSTFYKNWTDNEIGFNTENKQYKKSDYQNQIKFNENDIIQDLQKKIDEYRPDIIFWSAISSHIHGEGEYVNLEHGYYLIDQIKFDGFLVAGGIQITASKDRIAKLFPKIDIMIGGESEFVLLDIANNITKPDFKSKIKGIIFKNEKNELVSNVRQEIINDLDKIPNYDYSIFDKKTFLRSYNGKVLNAIDYELSRGCIYTCSYCVETIIQDYYGFKEKSKKGALLQSKKYLRSKSAERIYEELKSYKKEFGISLVRCQDTNFLTINSKVLKELEEMILKSPLDLKLYIETRPEGINEKTVKILKNLGVDGVGMGIELAGEEFRESELNRFADQEKIINAFKLLKEFNIKRTTYNIIGLPNQTEESIISTINFNKTLDPDNVTVAFYSPYLGTSEQIKSSKLNYFDDYEKNVDGQLRSLSKSTLVSAEKLNYYKKNFVMLVKNNI